MSEPLGPVCNSKAYSGDEIARAIVNLDADSLSIPVLRRLIEEVRNESDRTVGVHKAYDRVHNRHNR